MNTTKQINPQRVLDNLNLLTTISCIIIGVVAIILGVYVIRKKTDFTINRQRQWIEQIPSVVSSLGVFGTFLGITVGLYYFKTDDLDNSIPLLLSGLKTAFMTSLVGMSFSLILTRIVNWCFDSVDVDQNDLEKVHQLKIISSLNGILSYLSGEDNKQYRTDVHEMKTSLKQIELVIKDISTNIDQVKDDVEEIKGQCQEIKDGIGGDSGSVDAIHRLSAVMITATESIASMDSLLTTIKDYSEVIKEHVEDYADELDEIRKNLENN